MGPVRSGPDGYLRPVQFLDHLTVIKTSSATWWPGPEESRLCWPWGQWFARQLEKEGGRPSFCDFIFSHHYHHFGILFSLPHKLYPQRWPSSAESSEASLHPWSQYRLVWWEFHIQVLFKPFAKCFARNSLCKCSIEQSNCRLRNKTRLSSSTR